jgi:hypothetical protein
LERRGVALSAALCAVGLSLNASAAKAALMDSVVRASVLSSVDGAASGVVSAKASALAEGVSRVMFATKFKIATGLLVAASLFVAGVGALTCQALAAKGLETRPIAKAESQAPDKAARQTAADAAEKDSIFFSGQVLGPDGEPFAEAKLYLLNGDDKGDAAAKIRATTDKQGRFRLTASRDGWAALLVTADGCGPAWVSDLRKPDGLTLRLVKDDVPINGRIVDLQGKPVAGVTLKVNALKISPQGNLDAWLVAAKVRNDGEALERDYLTMLSAQSLARLFPPATTDQDGRFRLKGIGRERMAALIVEGPTVETQEINVATRSNFTTITLPADPVFPPAGQLRYYGPSFEHVAPPSRQFGGTVRARATGKPLAEVVVRPEWTVGNPPYRVQTTTDAEGRYRLSGLRVSTKFPFGLIQKSRDVAEPIAPPRALRAGVHGDPADTGQKAEGSLDQPAAGCAANAIDQHDRFAAPVGEGTHNMARELRALEGGGALGPIAQVGRANGRSTAQSNRKLPNPTMSRMSPPG